MITRLLKPAPDIVRAYDDLRQQENEALLHLLDVLPRVDGLGPDVMAQARDAVFHTDHPFLLALIGPFGVGKSSLINALLGADVLTTGPIPTTDHVAILRYGESQEHIVDPEGVETVFYPSPVLKTISLVDTPGLDSVFTQHSERTDSFLHRSDWVVLVMLATQALSAGNLAYLESLKSYGKRVVVVVNQADLLDEDQRQTVQDFVREQCVTHLGSEPPIFLVSARQGAAAQAATPPDEAGWQASGMAAFARYLTESLDDRERLRQKLHTPLQITRNVLSTAQGALQTQQQALDAHRSVTDNITAQIQAGREQQRQQVDATLEAVAVQFAETAQRGEDAIRDLFQPTRALGQIASGTMELIGVAGLARRLGRRSRAEAAFAEHEVLAPLDELPELVNALGPRLEGRDLQDIDDLVVYTNGALADLPETLRAKAIGEVQAPVSYNREPLRAVRGDLDGILAQARNVETSRLDRAVRNTMVMLAGWELAIVIAVVLLGVLGVDWSNPGLPIVMVLAALALMFLGVALFAYRGHLLARQFAARQVDLSQAYQSAVREAAEKQIQYGVALREDVAAPFTRLIRAQTGLLNDLAVDLRKQEDELAAYAGRIGSLWEREEA